LQRQKASALSLRADRPTSAGKKQARAQCLRPEPAASARMPPPAASSAADATDAPPARLGAGLNWANIGASDPEALRRRRAALLARLDADWRAAQAFWAAYRAARWPGCVFERSA
tara:strand:+ start:631 stop:975 length:345 start_codon:yes stop_codon:yes gene_type:complete